MSYQTIEYEVKNKIAWIYINRTNNGNTVNLQMASELADAAWKCGEDESIRAVVLTAKGKAFSFGGDLESFMNETDNKSQHLKEVTTALNEAILRFLSMEKPVITGINGTAAGAGIGLSIIGDIVIASEEAKLTLAYTNVGLTPDGATSYLLPRIVGLNRSLELVMLNRILTAEEANDWGLVTKVVEKDELMNELEKTANKLALGPVNALGKAKVLLNTSFDRTIESQIAKESFTISRQIATFEGNEGISAFLDKRTPDYLQNK